MEPGPARHAVLGRGPLPVLTLWGGGAVLTSSVVMAFSTNFISASCVKLNKFNFVIFFKKVTDFILNLLAIVVGRVNFPLRIYC